jgi:hypothetical protein
MGDTLRSKYLFCGLPPVAGNAVRHFVRRVVEAAGVEPHQWKETPRAWNPLFYMLFFSFGLILNLCQILQLVTKCVPMCTNLNYQ